MPTHLPVTETNTLPQRNQSRSSPDYFLIKIEIAGSFIVGQPGRYLNFKRQLGMEKNRRSLCVSVIRSRQKFFTAVNQTSLTYLGEKHSNYVFKHFFQNINSTSTWSLSTCLWVCIFEYFKRTKSK